MITDADIKKMKSIFATKDDLKRFATIDSMGQGFVEIIQFIGEVKSDIMTEFNKLHNEFVEFRNEMRDINRNSQSALNNHESRISHLEYINKS